MTDEQNKNAHPAERQPLFNKLEGQHSSSPWHNEAQEWSKTTRGVIQTIIDGIKSLLS